MVRAGGPLGLVGGWIGNLGQRVWWSGRAREQGGPGTDRGRTGSKFVLASAIINVTAAGHGLGRGGRKGGRGGEGRREATKAEQQHHESTTVQTEQQTNTGTNTAMGQRAHNTDRSSGVTAGS